MCVWTEMLGNALVYIAAFPCLLCLTVRDPAEIRCLGAALLEVLVDRNVAVIMRVVSPPCPDAARGVQSREVRPWRGHISSRELPFPCAVSCSWICVLVLTDSSCLCWVSLALYSRPGDDFAGTVSHTGIDQRPKLFQRIWPCPLKADTSALYRYCAP